MANIDKNFRVKNGLDVKGTINLAAIAESKSETAVDVFVYDTSKDTDGGAWRHRTQNTSWYNEGASSTRGSRKEFPAVAVIVVESAGVEHKVTIYDGDDPSLPMWMVFQVPGGTTFNETWIGRTNITFSSVFMVNGLLAFGSNGAGDSRGLHLAYFVSDSLAKIGDNYSYNSGYAVGFNVVDRNDGATKVDGTADDIINRTVNDVAMTVLPDAPIDPATGLPTPTIAVATDGGVSVIKDDGTVVDDLFTNRVYRVLLADQNLVWCPTSTPHNWFITDNVGDLQDGFIYDEYLRREDTTTAYPQGPQATTAGTRQEYLGNNVFVTSNTLSPSQGFFLYQRGEAVTYDQNKGMIAKVQSTYNTGWMNGDIKGAFLSDTDDTDLVDSGEIQNGTFDTSLTGWTYDSAAWSWDASGRAYHNFDEGLAGGKNIVTAFPGGDPEVGDQFYYSFDYEVVVGQLMVGDDYNATSGQRYISGTGTASGIIRITDHRQNNFAIYPENWNSLVQAYIDNVVVRKVGSLDRSVNNNGLIVNGTVTRTAVATGADLVAYSGFSSSNYLEQPYNSDLDFGAYTGTAGTGDFCVMGWIKTTVITQCIFEKGVVGSTGFSFELYLDGFLAKTGNSYVIPNTDLNIASGVWRHVAMVRRSGVLSFVLDAVETFSVSNSKDISAVDEASRIGCRTDGSRPAGSLALWRISATAPTADQITKIYNDEKLLFQENAQATLYGTSNQVRALAHDEDTGLLHVGTSAGRSEFQGLRRVDNTTDAVGAAISAVDGLVVEE